MAYEKTGMARIITKIILLMLPLISYGASFDCKDISTTIENVICDDKTLSSADDEMSSLYERVKTADPSVVEDQKQWLANVRDKCENIDCLSSAYLSRISKFETMLNDVRNAPPLEQPTVSEPLTEPVQAEGVQNVQPDAQTSTPQSLSQLASQMPDDLKIKIILGIAALLFLWYWMSGSSSKCPSCGKWHATRTISSTPINSRTSYHDVNRTDVYKDKLGRETGQRNRVETVPINITTYENSNACKYCGYRWKSQSESRS